LLTVFPGQPMMI